MAKRLDAAAAVSTALGASSRTVCYIVQPTYRPAHDWGLQKGRDYDWTDISWSERRSGTVTDVISGVVAQSGQTRHWAVAQGRYMMDRCLVRRLLACHKSNWMTMKTTPPYMTPKDFFFNFSFLSFRFYDSRFFLHLNSFVFQQANCCRRDLMKAAFILVLDIYTLMYHQPMPHSLAVYTHVSGKTDLSIQRQSRPGGWGGGGWRE